MDQTYNLFGGMDQVQRVALIDQRLDELVVEAAEESDGEYPVELILDKRFDEVNLFFSS